MPDQFAPNTKIKSADDEPGDLDPMTGMSDTAELSLAEMTWPYMDKEHRWRAPWFFTWCCIPMAAFFSVLTLFGKLLPNFIDFRV